MSEGPGASSVPNSASKICFKRLETFTDLGGATDSGTAVMTNMFQYRGLEETPSLRVRHGASDNLPTPTLLDSTICHVSGMTGTLRTLCSSLEARQHSERPN